MQAVIYVVCAEKFLKVDGEKMLSDGVEPSSILCLTFSDAAASEMRQRLIKKMGVKASSVDIYTYHSFCNDIIKEYPSQFEMSGDVRLITDTEKISLMKECIDEANLEYFVPARADKYFNTKNFISYVEKKEKCYTISLDFWSSGASQVLTCGATSHSVPCLR